MKAGFKALFFYYARIIPLTLLIGCMPPPGGYGPGGYGQGYYGGASTGAPGGTPPPRSDSGYDEKINRDGDRDEKLSSARRNGGDLCEDESKNHECRDQCKEMYRRANDREDCEELPVDQIEKLLDVHKALKNPTSDKLEKIDLEDMDVYLNVSIEAFDKLIRDYKRGDVEDIFFWITDDEEVAELIQNEDDDHRTLEGLLKVIRSYDNGSVEKPFVKGLYRDDTLFEMAIEAGNETAAEWFLDYIFETDIACHNDTEVSVGCWTVICAIGAGFNDNDNLLDFFDFSVFSNYVDDIIEGDGVSTSIHRYGINGQKWEPSSRRAPSNSALTRTTGTPDRYNSSDDVIEHEENGDWVQALCVGLAGITAS